MHNPMLSKSSQAHKDGNCDLFIPTLSSFSIWKYFHMLTSTTEYVLGIVTLYCTCRAESSPSFFIPVKQTSYCSMYDSWVTPAQENKSNPNAWFSERLQVQFDTMLFHCWLPPMPIQMNTVNNKLCVSMFFTNWKTTTAQRVQPWRQQRKQSRRELAVSESAHTPETWQQQVCPNSKTQKSKRRNRSTEPFQTVVKP